MAQLLAVQRAGLLNRHRQLLPAAARTTRPRSAVVRRYKTDGQQPQHQDAAEAAQAAVSQPQQADEGGKAKVVFQLPHHVEFGQDMCLVGEAEALGAWDVDLCVPMAWHDGDVWTAEAELPQGAEKIEYKYIVRQGNDEDEGVRDVQEWQPCMNLAVQVDGGLQELTVRDAWEGSQHEVLPGIQPIPIPAELPEESPEASPPAACEPAPAPTAAELPEAAAATLAAATLAAPMAPVVAADDAAAVDVEALLSGSSSDEGEGPAAALPASGAVMTAEQIAAATPDRMPGQAPAAAAAAAVAPAVLGGNGGSDTVHAAGADGNIQQHISQVRSKAEATVPAWLKQAAVEAAEDFDSLTTGQLKELCKKRNLPTKGQRSQLLARLQHSKA